MAAYFVARIIHGNPNCPIEPEVEIFIPTGNPDVSNEVRPVTFIRFPTDEDLEVQDEDGKVVADTESALVNHVLIEVDGRQTWWKIKETSNEK